ncbi:MAG: DoxX family protein [Actinomycetota bacterium]|nr:DoxX family protein [Actinomycetota bacterium]
MNLGRLFVRLVIGGLFLGHGTQKLRGWFGGPGLAGTEQMMGSLELQPARLNALAAGVTETGGGALLAAGLLTPLAAAGLIGTMVTAIRTVHLKNGPWAANGGYEYNLVLIAALVGLVDGGPGTLSADRALGIHDVGPRWAFGALAGGAAASALTVALGRRQAAQAAAEAAAYPEDGRVTEATQGQTAGDPVTTTA